MIEIIFNGEPRKIEPETTVQRFLISLNLNSKNGLAIALNHQVLSKDLYRETIISEGDKLEIIHATAGG